MLYQIVDLLLIEVDAANLTEAFDKLVPRELTVAILVEEFELLRQIVQLILAEKVLHKERMNGLLQTRPRVEILQGLDCVV